MKKWWHTFASVAIGAVAIAAPPLQTVIVAHPAVAAGLAFAWAILGHILPSPLKQPE
jgi:hypothetical protein